VRGIPAAGRPCAGECTAILRRQPSRAWRQASPGIQGIRLGLPGCHPWGILGGRRPPLPGASLPQAPRHPGEAAGQSMRKRPMGRPRQSSAATAGMSASWLRVSFWRFGTRKASNGADLPPDDFGKWVGQSPPPGTQHWPIRRREKSFFGPNNADESPQRGHGGRFAVIGAAGGG
jgi:hypothetical protein